MIRASLLLLVCFICSSAMADPGRPTSSGNKNLISVLILSGRNNHEWQKTTPVLFRIFKDSKLFAVRITEKPDTLNYASMKRYQLVISNWNFWPDNKIRMSNQWEADLLRYVKEGGGMLTFHAGASSFYDWEAYHRIGIGRWGKETRHGPRTKGRVYGLDQRHPITKGMGAFYIMDEIWEHSDIYSGASAIGSVSAKDEKDGHLIDFPAVFVNQTGKGRSFFTALGHDERALLNSGLQTLLLRAGQWCAGKAVTIQIPYELKASVTTLNNQLNWSKTDTTLALKNHSEIVWQFNYNDRFGKPYFHPLTINHSDLTCVSPPDHPWHLGLWFSWKFMNGINYWEYLKGFNSPESGFKSEGVTRIEQKKIILNSDFSANISLRLGYYPGDGPAVMVEERSIYLSKPDADGSYFIDEEHLFRALKDSVLLDRTPVTGEPGGQSWGGYAGLSIRFNQDYTSPVVFSPVDSTSHRKGNWIYMGFDGVTGKKVGLLMLTHPKFTPDSSCWYVISNPNVPFYYYSPAVLYDHSIRLKKGETLRLKYRIWIVPGEDSREEMQQKYDQFVNQ